MNDKLEIRVHGESTLPTLIYLPGLHGDWTLVGGFRRAVAGHVRFVEMTYPRTLTWSLEEYAAAIETALEAEGIRQGWLLGESYGSQVLWALIKRERFQAKGVILAGGFVRHPMRWGVRLLQTVGGRVPLAVITRILFSYAKVARFRYRHSPETAANIDQFIARRTNEDRHAAIHRLQLIAQNDPCATASQTQVPVYGLTGLVDPLVPWWFIRSWLRKHCRSLRDYRIILSADHNVLGTAPQAAAQQILSWMAQHPS